MIKVTVWNEFIHEREYEGIREIYPKGIHGCIADFLEKCPDIQVRTATLDEPEHGLTQDVLNDTDVLIWWSHARQEEVSDMVVERIQQRVLQGMGFIGLHSAHYSKIMKRLLGTSMTLRWRNDDKERLWCTCPSHPIAEGIPEYIDIPLEEMYGEFFDIPKPDDVVFTGWLPVARYFAADAPSPGAEEKFSISSPGMKHIQSITCPPSSRLLPMQSIGAVQLMQ